MPVQCGKPLRRHMYLKGLSKMARITLVYREGHGCVEKHEAMAIDAALSKTKPRSKLASFNVKMERGRWVFRDGGLVSTSEAYASDAKAKRKKRSSLPSPHVAPSFPEHRSMATGEIVSDRRRHREILKAHGLEEVGTSAQPMQTTESRVNAAQADFDADLKDAVELCLAGKGEEAEKDNDFKWRTDGSVTRSEKTIEPSMLADVV